MRVEGDAPSLEASEALEKIEKIEELVAFEEIPTSPEPPAGSGDTQRPKERSGMPRYTPTTACSTPTCGLGGWV